MHVTKNKKRACAFSMIGPAYFSNFTINFCLASTPESCNFTVEELHALSPRVCLAVEFKDLIFKDCIDFKNTAFTISMYNGVAF